ncbi:hypothetical protein [Amycolatopsis sp. Hca4]|uniref:hypothetical protein n=1 Tax=Amycolatopsis sp. Hca4 TaxID=2742131 RepID=UPI0015923D05|nr:hypothetical protein [Amycolatopsis sp. Hca4]QKV73917.1 hypothetical protein HUT10_09145 [Amycolatopsis sp. Hca4]
MIHPERVYEAEFRAVVRASSGRFARRWRSRLPAPDDRDLLGWYWSTASARAWLADRTGFDVARHPLRWWPDSPARATFCRSLPLFSRAFDLAPRAVVQEWSTPRGRVVVSWPVDGRVVPMAEVARAVPDAAAYLRVGARWTATGPDLVAVVGAAPAAAPMECGWADLARVLGLAAPYWPPGLRDPELIGRWRPGDPVVRCPASTVLPIQPLLELAMLYPANHPAHRALTHTAQRIAAGRTAGTPAAARLVALRPDQITFAAVDDGCAPVDPGPAPDPVLRLGWREVQNRDDVLAEQCIRIVHDFDGGEQLTHPQVVTAYLRGEAGAEFAARLRSCSRRAIHVLTDPLRIGAVLVDPASDAPAAVPLRNPGVVRVSAPRRLASISALRQVVLEDPVYIRDGDDTLHLAPRGPRSELGWGDDEPGTAALALLLERLLTDLAADPADLTGVPNAGLLELLRRDWPVGSVLDRAQVESHLVL